MNTQEQIVATLDDLENSRLPQHPTPEQLHFYAQLISEGYMEGKPVEDGSGQVIAILHAAIALKGRKLLDLHQDVRQGKKLKAQARKLGKNAIAWVFGTIVTAVIIAWILKILGLT